MKHFRLELSLLCCLMLALPGCGTLSNDAFAVHVKRNHTSAAISGIKPHSGYLRITETNGRTYFPIEYALINGNHDVTFALLNSGSPTRLYGKSLAYNAAYTGSDSLARSLADNGYGTRGDISAAKARKAADERRRAANAEAALLFGLGILAVLINSGGSGGGDGECGKCSGSGLMPTGHSYVPCSMCGGDGYR